MTECGWVFVNIFVGFEPLAVCGFVARVRASRVNRVVCVGVSLVRVVIAVFRRTLFTAIASIWVSKRVGAVVGGREGGRVLVSLRVPSLITSCFFFSFFFEVLVRK